MFRNTSSEKLNSGKPGGLEALEKFRARGTGRPPAVSVDNVDPGGNAMRRKPQTKFTESGRVQPADSLVKCVPATRTRGHIGPLVARRPQPRLRAPLRGRGAAWCIRATVMVVGCACVLGLPTIGRSQPPQPAPAAEVVTYTDVITRDRKWQRLFANVSMLLKSNQTNDALGWLQRCFQEPEDAYLLSPEWDHPAVRGIAAKILRDGGKSMWDTYEQLYGFEAKKVLERVEIDGPPGAYQRAPRAPLVESHPAPCCARAPCKPWPGTPAQP